MLYCNFTKDVYHFKGHDALICNLQCNISFNAHPPIGALHHRAIVTAKDEERLGLSTTATVRLTPSAGGSFTVAAMEIAGAVFLRSPIIGATEYLLLAQAACLHMLFGRMR